MYERYQDLLRAFADTPVFFDPLPGGNNGDLLIEQGSRHTHRKHRLRYVGSPAEARLIVLRGNGAMHEDEPAVLKILSEYAARYPTTALCLEPSTFNYRSLQIRDVLPERQAILYLFARESESFRYLRGQHVPGKIEVGLDHDMAFTLRASDLIERLRSRPSEHVLIVERLDVEHPLATRGHRPLAIRLYRRLLPKRLRRFSTPVVNRIRSSLPGELTGYMSGLVDREFPQFARHPRLYRDIGDVRTTTFSQFLDIIARSAVTVTTRLHVGILAAMLGKPTLLIVGDYKKMQWIYEYSLRGWSNVSLIAVPREAAQDDSR